MIDFIFRLYKSQYFSEIRFAGDIVQPHQSSASAGPRMLHTHKQNERVQFNTVKHPESQESQKPNLR